MEKRENDERHWSLARNFGFNRVTLYYLFIHLSRKYLLSIYYVPNTMLRPGGSRMNKTVSVPKLPWIVQTFCLELANDGIYLHLRLLLLKQYLAKESGLSSLHHRQSHRVQQRAGKPSLNELQCEVCHGNRWSEGSREDLKVEEELSAWKVVWDYRKADREVMELAWVYLQARAGAYVHQFSWLWVWMMGLEFDKTLGSEKKDVYIDFFFFFGCSD